MNMKNQSRSAYPMAAAVFTDMVVKHYDEFGIKAFCDAVGGYRVYESLSKGTRAHSLTIIGKMFNYFLEMGVAPAEVELFKERYFKAWWKDTNTLHVSSNKSL